MMPTHDSRRPPPRSAGTRSGTARHLFAVSDAAARDDDLAGHIIHLEARIRAGDETLAEVLGRLDIVEEQMGWAEAAGALPEHPAVAPLPPPPAAGAPGGHSLYAALAIGAAVVLALGYLVVGAAWRLVAPVLATWAP